MKTPTEIASDLTYKRRKALRRLGRGQTITNTMAQDPIVGLFYDTPDYLQLPEVYTVVEWCDWAARVSSYKRALNRFGLEVLHELEKISNEQPTL